MNREEALIYLNSNLKYLPKNKYDFLFQKLTECDCEYTPLVYALKFKNPKKLLKISLTLGIFGADRFLLGDKLLGYIKLFTLGGFGIVAIYDWFYIVKRVKKANYISLLSVCCFNNHNFCQSF